MAVPVKLATEAPVERAEASGAPWSLPRLVAFRFCFIYFGLYFLTTQIFWGLLPFPSPVSRWLGLVRRKMFDVWVTPLVSWPASHLFGAKLPLVVMGGSGDKTFDWVQAFCWLALTAVATAAWSAIDRKRQDHRGLYKWFRV